MGLRNCSLLRAAFSSVAAVSAALSLAADTYIRDVRIEFADGRVIDKGGVLIRDGKIVSAEAGGTAPSGAEVVDGTGLTAYPGFIDAYTTRGLKVPAAPAIAPAPSATTSAPPTMWSGNRKGIRAVKAADHLDLSSYAADARKSGIAAALLCPGGGIVRGQGALAYMTDEKQSPTAFGVELSFRGTGGGAPGGGGGGGQANNPNPYPGSLLGYVALLRQTLYDAQAYKSIKPEKPDADLEVLSGAFGGKTLISADSLADLSRALMLTEEFGLDTILVGGRDAWRLGPSMKQPVIVSIAIGAEPEVRESADGPPKDVLEARRQAWRERAANVPTLLASGAKVAFSSDGDGVSSYLANVRKIIAAGLKREDALKCMTVNPAAIFGMGDWGEIRSGAIANLTLMDGDFAKEGTKVKMVFVNGKKFEVAN